MIFNPGLFQAPDFFRLYGDGVEENGSACLAPIGPGQSPISHHFLFFPPFYTISLFHIYIQEKTKKERHLASPYFYNTFY
jgi:hypothetical protein